MAELRYQTHAEPCLESLLKTQVVTTGQMFHISDGAAPLFMMKTTLLIFLENLSPLFFLLFFISVSVN